MFKKHVFFSFLHPRNCIFGLFIPDLLSGTHFTADNITELLLWYKHIGLSRKHTNHIFFRVLRQLRLKNNNYYDATVDSVDHRRQKSIALTQHSQQLIQKLHIINHDKEKQCIAQMLLLKIP